MPFHIPYIVFHPIVQIIKGLIFPPYADYPIMEALVSPLATPAKFDVVGISDNDGSIIILRAEGPVFAQPRATPSLLHTGRCWLWGATRPHARLRAFPP